MPGTVRRARGAAKSRRFPEGNHFFPEGKQISPVMQKMRDLLPRHKAAWQLHCMTGQPLSICQKVLSGHRQPNVEMMQALLAADDVSIAGEALVAFIGKDAPLAQWIADKQDLRRLQAELDAIKARMAR